MKALMINAMAGQGAMRNCKERKAIRICALTKSPAIRKEVLVTMVDVHIVIETCRGVGRISHAQVEQAVLPDIV